MPAAASRIAALALLSACSATPAAPTAAPATSVIAAPAASPSPGPSPSPSESPSPSPSPLAGTLAGDWLPYSSDRDAPGDFDVFFYSPTADTVITLPGVNTAGDELDVALSSDGRWLTYVSDGAHGDFDVMIYDVLTRLRQALPGLNSRADEADTWVSTKADTILFTRQEGDVARLLLYQRATGQVERLPAIDRLEASVLDPHLSSDGHTIAFAANVNGHDTDIFFYDRRTQTLVTPPFVNTPFNEEAPVLSDDNKRLIFLSDRHGQRRAGRAPDFDVFLLDFARRQVDALPLINSDANAETPYFFDEHSLVTILIDEAGNGRYVLYNMRSGTIDTWPIMHQVGASDM